MRWKSHVRFGGRAGETDQPKGSHRAPVRPYSAHWLPDAKGIDGPERWRGAVDQAAKLHNARERARSREVGHDLGIDL